jgi:nicotinate-nucleotide adenylyltransferase
MTSARSLRLGLLGGTLDPVHRGHIAAAHAARQALALDRVFLLPAHVPSHRGVPGASGWHRFAMAAIAVEGEDGLAVSDMELARPGTTYTWDTLEALAVAGYRPSQLYFITGADAFGAIESWHRYPDLLDRAHFVVITRPGHPIDTERDWPVAVRHRVRTPDAVAPATLAVHSAGTTSVWLVEATTPDVSSTIVRERVQAGSDVDALTMPRVAAHIRRHGLYDARDTARTLHGEY